LQGNATITTEPNKDHYTGFIKNNDPTPAPLDVGLADAQLLFGEDSTTRRDLLREDFLQNRLEEMFAFNNYDLLI
jgi:hypothetical protein